MGNAKWAKRDNKSVNAVILAVKGPHLNPPRKGGLTISIKSPQPGEI
jgi:hypothetical protein